MINNKRRASAQVANAIRSMREFRGLTQLGLAEQMGVTQAFVSRLEDPRYGRWSFRTLAKVGNALRCRLRVNFDEPESGGAVGQR